MLHLLITCVRTYFWENRKREKSKFKPRFELIAPWLIDFCSTTAPNILQPLSVSRLFCPLGQKSQRQRYQFNIMLAKTVHYDEKVIEKLFPFCASKRLLRKKCIDDVTACKVIWYLFCDHVQSFLSLKYQPVNLRSFLLTADSTENMTRLICYNL